MPTLLLVTRGPFGHTRSAVLVSSPVAQLLPITAFSRGVARMARFHHAQVFLLPHLKEKQIKSKVLSDSCFELTFGNDLLIMLLFVGLIFASVTWSAKPLPETAQGDSFIVFCELGHTHA